eukprot:m.145195 g.145195  ORF g.145195 m.145195 type:complete len:821 (+) comp16779_c0_seq2:201-2663(+)
MEQQPQHYVVPCMNEAALRTANWIDETCVRSALHHPVAETLRNLPQNGHYFVHEADCKCSAPNECPHPKRLFNATRDSKRRLSTYLWWKLWAGPGFPLSDELLQLWRRFLSCEFGILKGNGHRKSNEFCCSHPVHYTPSEDSFADLLKTLTDHLRQLQPRNALLEQFLTPSAAASQSAPDRVLLDLFSFLRLCEFVPASATPPARTQSFASSPMWGGSQDRSGDDKSSVDTPSMDVQAASPATDVAPSPGSAPSEDFKPNLADQLVPAEGSDAFMDDTPLSLEELDFLCLGRPSTAGRVGDISAVDLEAFLNVDNVRGGMLYSNDASSEPMVFLFCGQCCTKFLHPQAGLTSETVCPFGHRGPTLLRPPIEVDGHDIAYHMVKAVNERDFVEGDVVALLSQNQAMTIDRLTAANYKAAKNVGVVSRSAYLKADVNVARRRPHADSAKTDLVCMLGHVPVRVRGSVACGENVYADPQCKVEGCAVGAELWKAENKGVPARLIGQALVDSSVDNNDDVELVMCFVSLVNGPQQEAQAMEIETLKTFVKDTIIDHFATFTRSQLLEIEENRRKTNEAHARIDELETQMKSLLSNLQDMTARTESKGQCYSRGFPGRRLEVCPKAGNVVTICIGCKSLLVPDDGCARLVARFGPLVAFFVYEEDNTFKFRNCMHDDKFLCMKLNREIGVTSDPGNPGVVFQIKALGDGLFALYSPFMQCHMAFDKDCQSIGGLAAPDCRTKIAFLRRPQMERKYAYWLTGAKEETKPEPYTLCPSRWRWGRAIKAKLCPEAMARCKKAAAVHCENPDGVDDLLDDDDGTLPPCV